MFVSVRVCCDVSLDCYCCVWVFCEDGVDGFLEVLDEEWDVGVWSSVDGYYCVKGVVFLFAFVDVNYG